MKKIRKAFFSLTAAFLMLLTVVQVPVLSTDRKACAVLPETEIRAVQTAPAAVEPLTEPAAPAQKQTIAAQPTGTAVLAESTPAAPEPRAAQPAAVSAQPAADEPQTILPGIIYDESNGVLYGPNGKGLLYVGFDYDMNQDLFYSSLNCWQKAFGYNNLYDTLAPLGAMIFDNRAVYFNYGGVNWMLKLWKGQYGITSGAEVGMYKQSILSSTHYKGVSEEDFVMMDLTLYRHGELYYKREPQMHWWLSGFILGDVTVPDNLRLETNVTFKDAEMAGAFLLALSMGEDTQDVLYTVEGSTVSLVWQ